MNQVQLIGNLTKDIELRKTTEGKSVVNFTLAVTRLYDREKADFIQCQVWGKSADAIAEYCHKGSKLGITGEIRTGSYEKNGQMNYTTNIIVSHFEFLTPKTSGESQNNNFGTNIYSSKNNVHYPFGEDETVTQKNEIPDSLDDFGIGSDDLPF